MRYFNPISKFIFFLGVPIVSWGIANELFLWIKSDLMDLPDSENKAFLSATFAAKRLLPVFKKNQS